MQRAVEPMPGVGPVSLAFGCRAAKDSLPQQLYSRRRQGSCCLLEGTELPLLHQEFAFWISSCGGGWMEGQPYNGAAP